MNVFFRQKKPVDVWHERYVEKWYTSYKLYVENAKFIHMLQIHSIFEIVKIQAKKNFTPWTQALKKIKLRLTMA